MMRIIFEDNDMLVLDKPSGLVVNRSGTTDKETLQDRLSSYFHLGNSLGVGERAGIVHRLDRETSGLMVVAKNGEGFLNLQAQFKNREIQKEYVALVHDVMNEKDGVINEPIGRIGGFGKFGIVTGGRESVTAFTKAADYQIKDDVFKQNATDYNKNRTRYLKSHAEKYSLLSLYPKTGRTHQIRVHLKSLNHPLVSDLIYGPRKLVDFDLKWCKRLFLHAKAISITHPKTGENLFFESALPEDLTVALDNLNLIA